MNVNSKFKLRKIYQSLRSQTPQSYRGQASTQAADLLTSQEVFAQCENIALYLAYKDEFNTNPILEMAWLAKKKCYLPVLSNDKKLMFVRYEHGDALHKNRYSILEPINISLQIPAEDLELVIVPLLAFDRQGNRLGTGGGFYDYSFSFLKNNILNHPILVGLGYAVQEATSIPSDPWDIALKNVLTEKEWIMCAQYESRSC